MTFEEDKDDFVSFSFKKKNRDKVEQAQKWQKPRDILERKFIRIDTG